MTTASARLDLRLNQHDKSRIARAAALRGMAVSSFVRDVVLRETENALLAESLVALSPQESRRFMDALDKPFRPNARLAKAMKAAAKLTQS